MPSALGPSEPMPSALGPLPSAFSSSRYADVSRVLFRVLFLNLGVAIAKIAFGYSSGAISILSDGFHSLTDAASNVVGLIGVKAARAAAGRGSSRTGIASTRRSRPRR